MTTINPVGKRREAEVASEWYGRETLGCVATRRTVKAKFNKVDFFAADMVGKRKDGSHVYIQVTAGQADKVRIRRRKLEKYPWHKTDTVQIVRLIQTIDPANARRKLWFFRVHAYDLVNGKRQWSTEEQAVRIPSEWFKAYKEEE